MAWYYGKFACGCEGRTNVIGPVKNRQWIADKRFEKMCPDCWEKQLENKKEQEFQKALKNAKEMELPELQGSEKQVRWALVLRQKFIDEVTENKGWNMKQEFIDLVLNFAITNYCKSTWYIDGRCSNKALFIEAAKAYKKNKDVEKTVDKQLKKEIQAEAIVIPENRGKPGVVEINIDDEKIILNYVKDDMFRKVVKKLGFTWDRRKRSWTRVIPGTAGTPQDRAGEAGNKLLNAGFAVRIYDHEARQKAIEGSFEPEHTRWVYVIIKGEHKGWFAIEWRGRNNDLYDKARSLPGSKWSNPFVVIKPEFYQEVEEFAELYDFKITRGAKDVIKEQKDFMENAARVVPVEVIEEEQQKDGLQKILESNSEVIADLRDD